MSDRPLHPRLDENIFQHPVKGFTYKDGDDRIMCYVNDVGEGGDRDDTVIYVGVEVHHSRVGLGAWLMEHHYREDPQEAAKMKLLNHLFVEEVFPIDFNDEEKAETVASRERVSMAQSVISAGGACTICEAPNDPNEGVDHIVGCEYMSWLMWAAVQAVAEGQEPTLDDVVRSAEEQIARMQ